MKYDQVTEYLRSRKDLSDWTWESSHEHSRELFFTRRRKDLSRAKDVEKGRLCIHADGFFPDGKPSRGSAVVSVPQSILRSELEALVDKALERARVSPTPRWSLPAPFPQPALVTAGAPAVALDLALLAVLRDAAFSAEEKPTNPSGRAHLAALELFLTEREHRLTSSTGADFHWSDLLAEAEAVAVASPLGTQGRVGTASSGLDEAELVESWSSSAMDPQALRVMIARLLNRVVDRADARPLYLLGDTPILITGDAVPEFFGYYFNRLSAPQIHMGASDARLGDSVYPFASDIGTVGAGGAGSMSRTSGTGGTLPGSRAGDLPTLGFDPALPGGTENRPADADGFALERTVLAEKGIIRAFEGPSRYASWLDVPAKGACTSRWVSPGTLGDAGLKAMDHLEACVFSDFYVDHASGDFGGELRLGILHRGNTRIPLTGGSISGSISQECGALRFTETLDQHGPFLGPSGVLLGKARIAAVEG